MFDICAHKHTPSDADGLGCCGIDFEHPTLGIDGMAGARCSSVEQPSLDSLQLSMDVRWFCE